MGLNDEMYGTMRSSIIQEELLPKLKTIFARICKEEQHRSLTRAPAAEDDSTGGIGMTFTLVNRPATSNR